MAEEKKEEQKSPDNKKKQLKFIIPLFRFLSFKKFTEILRYLLMIVILIIVILLSVWFFTREKTDGNDNISFFGNKGNTNINSLKMPPGVDWYLTDREGSGIIVNTADNDEDHFLKYNISIFCEKDNLILPQTLQMRKSQIQDEIRKIIGSKTFSFLKSVENQEIIRMEIKRKIQAIVGYDVDGIINVYFTEFTLH